MKRVGIFVDVSNLYYSIKEKYQGGKLDYTAFTQFVGDGFGEVTMKIAYGADKEGESYNFRTVLKKIGYEIKYKEPKLFNTVGIPYYKADQDVAIAIDMVANIDSLDRIILACADGDLAPAVDYVQERGVEVVIIASSISKDLKSRVETSVEIPESLLVKRG